MDQKVCIDTDVAIAILNNEERAREAMKKIGDSEVYITTITLFELMLRKTNLEAIELFQQKVDVMQFDEGAARKASMIFKELQQKGRTADIRDIFIAATCVTTGCALITFNTKHFEHIEELQTIR